MDSDKTVQGSCFGFAVRSSLPLVYLRDGGGDAPLHVAELNGATPAPTGQVIARWTGGPDKMETRLHSSADLDRLWLENVGWFEIDSRVPAIGVPRLPSQPTPTTSRDEQMAWREATLWGMPVVVCFTRRGFVPVHAASVEVAGSGMLLAAPGTFGKTTLAAAFLRERHRLLSDDMACCDLRGVPTILPGPAVLRLRRDVVEWLRVPAARFAYATPTKVAFALQPKTRGDGTPVPLRAIVLLRKTDGAPRVARADPSEAVRDLFVLSPKAVFDAPGAFQDIAKLVATVPVWYFDRKLKADTLRDSVNLLVETCLNP